jgi:hypothetical protein
MRKTNCWEHKSCGRQPGGDRVAALGVCPAATSAGADGLNQGTSGGRACWVIAGTLCGGAVQGTFAAKMTDCVRCDFYARVKAEEGQAYIGSTRLLTRLLMNH